MAAKPEETKTAAVPPANETLKPAEVKNDQPLKMDPPVDPLQASPMAALTPSALEKAQKLHAKTMRDAEVGLLESVDKMIDRVSNQRLPTTQKSALLDVLRAERNRLERSGLIPTSERMLPAVIAYAQVISAAEATLRKTYNVEIEKAIRARNDRAQSELRTELARAISAKVVAKWRHQAANGPIGTVQLYSNGRINHPESQAIWRLDASGQIVLNWPTINAPGGAWIDTCKLSPDGKTYSGRNQNKVLISGWCLSE